MAAAPGNNDGLWDPPLRKARLQDDYMYPFGTGVIRATIPDGCKQNLLPPVVTVLDNAYPKVDPKPGSLATRIDDGSERGPPFGKDDDASSVIRSEDVDEAVGFRTFLFPGYRLIPCNESLDIKYPPVHRLSFDDRRKIAHHNTSVRSRALVSASSCNIIHWAGCTQEPSQRGNETEEGRHCEKDSVFQPGDCGEIGENSTSYPPEIRCYENAHSRLVALFSPVHQN